jgi:hypothetical protein
MLVVHIEGLRHPLDAYLKKKTLVCYGARLRQTASLLSMWHKASSIHFIDTFLCQRLFNILWAYNMKRLKGQSHEKVGEMRVESDSLGPN